VGPGARDAPAPAARGRLRVERLKRGRADPGQVKGAPAAVDDAGAAAVLAAAAPFQNGYLGAALARMTDAVAAAFPGGARALPTSAELQKCIGRAPMRSARPLAAPPPTALLRLGERARLRTNLAGRVGVCGGLPSRTPGDRAADPRGDAAAAAAARGERQARGLRLP